MLDNKQTVWPVEDFLAYFTHELRSSINSARFTVERFRRKRFEHSPQLFDEQCRRLQAQLDRLQKTIDGARAFQEILTGKVVVEEEMSRTSLYEFLQRSASQSNDMMERNDLQIIVDPKIKDLCDIRLDRYGFELAVFHLLDNAVKYSSGGTKIRIHGRQERRWVVLTFTNIGIEIPRDKNIFDRFVRTKDALYRAPHSAGLGLFLVKNIVEAHGGRVKASSVPHERNHLVKIELHFPIRQHEKSGTSQRLRQTRSGPRNSRKACLPVERFRSPSSPKRDTFLHVGPDSIGPSICENKTDRVVKKRDTGSVFMNLKKLTCSSVTATRTRDFARNCLRIWNLLSKARMFQSGLISK
jgi:two-component sensor histidine kinase